MDESDMGFAVSEMERLARRLIPLLLVGEDPRVAVLLRQWHLATLAISSPSSVGFYADISVPPEVERVQAEDCGSGSAVIPVGGEALPAGCILYVVNGALHFLEVYNYASWERPPVFGEPEDVEPFAFSAPKHVGQGA